MKTLAIIEALAKLVVPTVALVLIVGWWWRSRQTPDASAAATVDARELCDAYSQNEVAADQTFKDKSVLVTGVVNGIVSGSGGASVDLYCAGADVSAEFNEDQRTFVATLKDGDPVALLCLGDGAALGPRLRACRKAE